MSSKRNRFHLQYVYGAIWFVYMAANLLLYIVPIICLSLIKLIIPIRFVRWACYRIMEIIYQMAVAANVFLFDHILGFQMEVTGLEELNAKQDHVLLVNHSSWMDIPLLQNLLHRRAPIPKFIAKWEVLYIPLVGLICWAYEYPLVRRYNREYLRQHPEKVGHDLMMLKRHFARRDLAPSSIVIFPDGGRFSPEKAAREKSPHNHLLKPKAGGLTNTIQALGSRLEGIFDLTIVYDCDPPVFWNLLSSRCRRIVVKIERIQLFEWFEQESQGTFFVNHESVADRLNDLWRVKDQYIEQVKTGFSRSTTVHHQKKSRLKASAKLVV